MRDRGGFNDRYIDNFLLNQMITPVEDAASGEADKPAGGGQDSRKGIVKKKQITIFFWFLILTRCFGPGFFIV